MKRKGNLYQQIYNPDNLRLADANARKRKLDQYGVKLHDKTREENIVKLHEMLKNKTYKTSAYTTFTIFEPKERLIFRLPYFPDRIAQHAAMNILEDIFVNTFTANTYSCIKGRGIHAATFALRNALKNESETKYCLKLDIKKFYPSVDHTILKQLLRRKFKDKDLLWFLDEIIDSADGLPIGNYLSQYLANFYLSYFDHWIKEVKREKYYFRYADDIVLLSSSKQHLHQLLDEVRNYLKSQLNLSVKENYQVFPVAVRGIDFVGYKTFHTHALIRKSIKQNFARAIAKGNNDQSVASYMGWAKYSNSKHLLKKLFNEKMEGL